MAVDDVYRSKLDVATAMVEKPDGRIERGLERQIADTGSNQASVTVCNNLKMIKRDLEVAACFRQDVLPGLPDPEFDTACTYMESRLPLEDWPASTIHLCVSRSLRSQREKGDMTELVNRAFPIGTVTFNIRQAYVCGLPKMSDNSKISVFIRVVLRETIMVMINDGLSKADEVLAVCTQCQKMLKGVDPLEVAPEVMPLLSTCVACVEFWIYCLNPQAGPEYEECVSLGTR